MRGNFLWQVVLLLFLASAINYLDRSALSVAAPLVSRDLGIAPADLGLIFSSFFLGYALFNFIGGWAADRIGGKLVFVLAMTVWSVFCGMTAVAAGFASLFVIRVIFGIGEGPLSTTINKVINNWFPHREAASAVGIANAGSPLGGAIAGPVVGLLAYYLGWRVSFVLIGALGLAWVAAWLLRVTETPDTHPRVIAAERREIAASRPPLPLVGGHGPGLGWYLRQPTVLATALAFFGYNYILYFFLTWFPSYLIMAQRLSLKDMSLATALPWALGFVGLALGGWVSDLVFRRTGRPLFARKLVLSVCLGVAAVCVALAGLVTSVGGFVHGVANCSGIIGPAVAGFIVQATGAFTSAFVLAGGVAILGVLAVLPLVRPAAEAEPRRVVAAGYPGGPLL